MLFITHGVCWCMLTSAG